MTVQGCLAASAVAAAVVLSATAFVRAPRSRSADDSNREYVGNVACRRCHEDLYESYARTPMGRTSGTALEGLVTGSFAHARSGVTYRVFWNGENAVLSYERPGDASLRGTQALKYYIGSNTRGRAFLFEIDGFLYQTPINYYAKDHLWGMSPGYDGLTEMQLNHAVDASCLFCHAGRVQSTVAGTANRFSGAPFLQNGVACETCHGPGGGHVNGRAPMIDPETLSGERRDSVCLQCHLEGQSRIRRPGRRLEDYRPGDRLSDYLSIFVDDDAAKKHPGAVSQVESLAASTCKRKAGDAMSCMTCHDPHLKPTGQASAGYYRDKCLRCHVRSAANSHFGAIECTSCHMPRLQSADIAHTAVTDHRILRDPKNARTSQPLATPRLVQFGNTRPDTRDLGLAHAELGLRGNQTAGREARRLLEMALPRYPADPDVLTWLGYLHQRQDDRTGAAEFYERALKSDPHNVLAATNLGVTYAQRGLMREALQLWSKTFDANPQASEVGVNLAIGLCAAGDAEDASRVVDRVLRHNPDFRVARQLIKQSADGPRCAP